MTTSLRLAAITIAIIAITICLTNCRQTGAGRKVLTIAINSGVEGDALRQAARDYEQQTGIHINIAEFPYANLFEKEADRS
jgi:ABC-type glycerol-3-phosphate transport system substrate-binding protein